MSGQAEQELGKGLGEKVEREVTGKIGRWEVGGTQDVGRYVYPVRADRKENDAGEDKDVGKKVDTCVQFHQKECFEHKDCWEYDEKVGSMKTG